ncbi:MAG: histidine phosphatase family protein [Chloroflexota bacterium]|nr:histidine phosphatase family protein [Chloroflexota bacterium]
MPLDRPTRRLYLLRHGEVAYFDDRGKALDPWAAPLSERGRRQIGQVAAQMTASGVDRIVTSAVPRALETADILADRLGLAPVADEAWNEIRPGDLAAIPDRQLRSVIVDAYRNAASPGARFFGGELFSAFAGRVGRGLDRLLADPGWTTLAVVTHDPVARYVIARALGLGLAGLRFFEQDAGGLNVIDWAADPDGSVQPIVRLINGTPDNLVKAGPREPALVRFHRGYRASREAG